MTLDEFVPLLQTLAWIVFIGIILFIARKPLSLLLQAMMKNIEGGSSVETPWFKVGQRVPQERETSNENVSLTDRVRSVSLRHSVGKWEKQSDGITRRPIRIWLDWFDEFDPGIWERIEKVVYYLPTSWISNRIRTETNKDESFLLETAAYGEFTVGAEIYYKGEKEPWRINRYVNFFDSDGG
jgi:hypothetical protein